jgi:sugar phosphate isomerase/epimerase
MLPRGGGRFGSRPEHFRRIEEAFPHRSLGFCLDTGHALVAAAGSSSRFAELLDAMKGRLVAFHLADNAGDRDSHLAPGRGRVPWKLFFRSIADLEIDRAFCIETPPFGAGPPYAGEDWRAMVVETEELAAGALVDL